MQKLPQRKQIRLKEYDYSNAGYYFITVCTKDRKKILSKITCRGGFPCPPEIKTNQNTFQIVNTQIGNNIEKTINYINNKYKNIQINNYIIMPDHIHLIIQILETFKHKNRNITGGHGNPPLHKIITELKSFTTKMYNEINKTKYLKLWQRNYYEHVIRNEKEYLKIIEYINNNPIKWINNMS